MEIPDRPLSQAERIAIRQHIRPEAPTMGNLDKVRYTHQDMIDFILLNPTASQGEIAARYGYTQSWVSNIMASDAWQAAMAARREEIIDPAFKATLEERYRGLAILSVEKLMRKLEAPQVSDNVVLRAAELGAKACGIGGMKAQAEPAQVINIFNADNLARYVDQKMAARGVTYEEPKTLP